ncbi:MAG: diaminopimelate epimerase [Acidobacteriota bacterium]
MPEPRASGVARFAKTEALGNDFLLVPEEGIRGWKDRSALARSMCHRLKGLGADGLIFFSRAGEGRDYTMKLLNPDGSDAEISGNGLRCLGAYLKLSGRVLDDRFTIETGSGARRLEMVSRDGPRFVFRADMGAPRLESEAVPFQSGPPSSPDAGTKPAIGVPLEVGGRTVQITALSMGNPQCVLFVDRLEFDQLRELGPRIETHPRFPQRTNVEFVEVRNRSELAIGIWERGAGETAASGTGSAAATVAAVLSGKAGEKVTVHCPGGDLEVEWRGRQRVYVTGEAVVVAEGSLYLEKP